MGEWQKVSLGDLGNVIGGATPSTKDDSNYGGEIAWITPKDLSNYSGRYISHGERNITEKGLKGCSTRLMPANTILFTSRAPIGYIAIASTQVCTNQGFKSIVPNKDTDSKFLYYLLKYNKEMIESMGSGTTFKEVSGSTMKNIEVMIPKNKDDQIKIGEILSCLDDKIELNNKINDYLEQMAQAIFKSWFIDFEPFQDGEFYDTELGSIPVGWSVGVLGDLLESTKKAFKAGDNTSIPYVPIDTIPMNSLGLNEFKPNEEAQSSLITFNKDDILIGAMRVYFHRVSIAPCKGITRTTCFVLKPYSKNYLEYSLLLCNQNGTIDFAQNTSKGSTMPYAVWDNGLANMPIVIPPQNIAVEYSKISAPIIEKLRDSLFENNKSSNIRDSLLPKLMSGELSVSDI